MDMGIVNAGNLPLFIDIPKESLDLIEDVLFNRQANILFYLPFLCTY